MRKYDMEGENISLHSYNKNMNCSVISVNEMALKKESVDSVQMCMV